MRILGINHVGLAPKDPAKAKWFFGEVLGLDLLGEEVVREQKTNTIMFATSHGRVESESRFEILENQGNEDGPIARFLASRGGGIHHLAVTVDDVEAAIAKLKANGVAMVDESPRPGAHSTRIAFVHPRSTGGILVELVEESAK